uniref:Uncharacterized protein n=1 Tax=Phaseolus vulgaris TaxID=3885 RepID=V7AYA1_PHAVU|nr:hypothetical protein PHAVU_009G220300g [Phaseolus vulgaris]ESW10564.1 hypothetical protein PHAVU_009G220300g [Phaseolus vulgaris]
MLGCRLAYTHVESNVELEKESSPTDKGRWGYLSRADLWDKSHLMRQIEKYADIYTSRVSNFLYYTPFMHFRSQEQNLAHDSHTNYCSRVDKFPSNGKLD